LAACNHSPSYTIGLQDRADLLIVGSVLFDLLHDDSCDVILGDGTCRFLIPAASVVLSEALTTSAETSSSTGADSAAGEEGTAPSTSVLLAFSAFSVPLCPFLGSHCFQAFNVTGHQMQDGAGLQGDVADAVPPA
jgi:hypothetical protein